METLDEIKKRVDEIIELSGDPERAHSLEDNLYLELMEQFMPPAVWSEVERLSDADFPRWCA